MMEPEEVRRYARHAEALGRAIDDPEGARQALDILALFTASVNANIVRLRVSGDASLFQLSQALGISRQAVSQRWPKQPLHRVFTAEAPAGASTQLDDREPPPTPR
jgi:hypothetical protein